jgi:hypothetical protein
VYVYDAQQRYRSAKGDSKPMRNTGGDTVSIFPPKTQERQPWFSQNSINFDSVFT